jgi:hypothetical protein
LAKQQAADMQLHLKQEMRTKAALEVLILKKQHGLITDDEFKMQAKWLI